MLAIPIGSGFGRENGTTFLAGLGCWVFNWSSCHVNPFQKNMDMMYYIHRIFFYSTSAPGPPV